MCDRLREFSLALHPEKTRLIEFGRFAVERRAHRRLGKPETFICGIQPNSGFGDYSRLSCGVGDTPSGVGQDLGRDACACDASRGRVAPDIDGAIDRPRAPELVLERRRASAATHR
jgi:hypothetical protein